jgi:hypothetical protein
VRACIQRKPVPRPSPPTRTPARPFSSRPNRCRARTTVTTQPAEVHAKSHISQIPDDPPLPQLFIGLYIYIYICIASHLSYSPSVGVQSYNISMYKRGEDDRATLENRRKKKYIYICRICTQNHSLGRPILTRRIYNISSSSSSSAVYSSTNLLRVLTRTHTHICVVTIVVPPSRRGILRSLYKTIAAVEGAQILRIVYICTLRRGGGVVEFIPDVPNFPPSSIYY